MTGDEVYLRHILDAIERIEGYTTEGRAAFLSDSMRQDAVVRQLEVLGEAVKLLSTATKERAPQTPWREIAGMRDVLVHQYFAVDVDQVWEATQDDLARLRQEIERILEDH